MSLRRIGTTLDGYTIFKHERKVYYPPKAAYGLYLIAQCRRADELGKLRGHFVEADTWSEEEWLVQRRRNRSRRVFKDGRVRGIYER